MTAEKGTGKTAKAAWGSTVNAPFVESCRMPGWVSEPLRQLRPAAFHELEPPARWQGGGAEQKLLCFILGFAFDVWGCWRR